MIVTFHIALYFAYHIWESYISGLFRNNDNGPNPNESSSNVSSSPTSLFTVPSSSRANEISINEPNPTLRSRNEMLMSKTENICRQVKENEKDLHPCMQHVECDEEDGFKIIYNVKPKFECILEENVIKFIPPVYTQRYMVIDDILKKPSWSECINKVVDFGCAELTFEMKYLKKQFGIQEIVAVDIDSDMLSNYSCKVSPTPIDYIQPRPTPLRISVFCGSVAHTHEVLAETDAVIAIELIEHLYPEELECLPFNVFGFIKPKIAIFTTPNADFNVLFPNFSGFRHYDHKFEWSQHQFEDWGNNLVQRYPDYTVAYQGVGPGPLGTEHLGCCSQMATFIKVCHFDSPAEDEIHVQDGPYTLIQEYVYPYFVDKRTREEKIRDDAIFFINRCMSLSRQFDEVTMKEIQLKTIMERIKCFNREKLKDILVKNNWEVKMNENGYEVIVLPESDNEDDDDSCSGHNEETNELLQNDNTIHCDDTLLSDENWDSGECKSKVYVNSSINSDSAVEYQCIPDKSVLASKSNIPSSDVGCICDAHPDKTSCNNCTVCNLGKEYSIPETVVPDLDVCDRFNYSKTDIDHKRDTSLDCSVYETPFNGCAKTDCELARPTGQSVHYNQHTANGCNRELSFDTPDVLSSDQTANEHMKTISFCCVSDETSSFNNSIYSTPCCSQLHKQYIPKCLSLQQINAHCGSPSLNTELEESLEGHVFIGEHSDKFSKSMEGLKTQETCDFHETSSNASKILDSGYPDSYSEHNMDMDLTLEQFDDIETESEGNDVSSRSISPLMPPAPQIPRMIDDVENGDVANNNRDGEGNNMVADMEEDPFEFVAQIVEVINEIPNLAVVEQQGGEFCNRPKPHNPDQAISAKHSCTPSKNCMADKHSSLVLPQTPCSPRDSDIKNSLQENKAMAESFDTSCNNSLNKQIVKSAKSDSSIVTHCSWSHLDSSASQSCFDVEEGVDRFGSMQGYCKLKTHNSLTTVLDGCSKFSSCSLVSPIVKEDMHNKLAKENDCSNSAFPKWLLNINDSEFERSRDIDEGNITKENNALHLFAGPSQQDHPSLESGSAASSSSIRFDCNVESTSFPEWLLDIQISDSEYFDVESVNSVGNIYNNASYDELTGLNYDVQVDVRGGGDPQRESWH